MPDGSDAQGIDTHRPALQDGDMEKSPEIEKGDAKEVSKPEESVGKPEEEVGKSKEEVDDAMPQYKSNKVKAVIFSQLNVLAQFSVMAVSKIMQTVDKVNPFHIVLASELLLLFIAPIMIKS